MKCKTCFVSGLLYKEIIYQLIQDLQMTNNLYYKKKQSKTIKAIDQGFPTFFYLGPHLKSLHFTSKFLKGIFILKYKF